MYGKTPIKPAKVSPIPSVTNKAGNAQHSNVPKDVNKLNDGIII